ncbi:znii2cys6 transcription factor eurofung [Trichoderma arundinaceum]|uniref:Znii2cys6 transcription factor eurofung n=1 Tax=Trichoderma arundinaceum TaxID=490622 RepID=A0A395NJW0_TRIAR|nr:znii2cys6 transcription factor eurofung [Trichoderma arundinaceum]
MPLPPLVRYARLEGAYVPLILRFIQAGAEEQAPEIKIAATEDSLAKTLHFGPPSDSMTPTTTRFAWVLLIFSPDQHPAGLLIYYHNYSTWMAAPGVRLEELYVVPEYRRHGYARILIEAMASAAEAAGYMDIHDLYNLFDIEGNLTLSSECDAFLQIPGNTASPVAHPVLALDDSAALGPDSWTSEQEVIPKQRQRRYAPRTRQGCLTCRARRKRCDTQRPICRTCTRLNAECRWPDKLQISGYSGGVKSPKNQDGATTINAQADNVDVSLATDAYPTASTTTHESVPRSLAAKTTCAPQPNSTEASLERHLLSYYIHTFIPQVTVVQSASNFFTSLYIPMAFHHTGVMDAIIASAAAHLAKSVHGSEKAQELNSVVLQRQQRAREFITEHTKRPKHSESEDCKLEVVVVLLLLIGLESQTGGRSLRWMQRVNCVRQLLQTYPVSATKAWSAWEAECIHRHFLYHDVMALIMEDVLDPETRANLSNRSGPFTDCAATRLAPQMQGLSGQEIVTTTPVPPLEILRSGNAAQGADCLLGLSKDLFSIITQLRGLPSRDSQLIDMDAPEFLKLETDISNWQYDHEMASTLDLNNRLDLIALSECHRLAALILLYRRHSSRFYCLPHLASQIMCIVSRITPSGAVVAALAPVLFLAGAELNSEVDMALCAARLKSIREASKMMNIASAEEVLRVVWEERLQNRVRTDWLEILRARRWTFSLG